LNPYHYECADEGCKEVVCNECIETGSEREEIIESFNMLETISKRMEYIEDWKKMNFLKRFEATGKALDSVCRLYPVKIVQQKKKKDELD